MRTYIYSLEQDKAWAERRFWPKVKKHGECWLWHGQVRYDGYGAFTRDIEKRSNYFYAHIFAYSLINGPVPDGLVLDHLCRKRRCVNPAHLEAVTRSTNVVRGVSPAGVAVRTGVCKRGHDLAVEGYLSKRGRQCRACKRELRDVVGARAYYVEHRDSILAKHRARYALRRAA